MNEIGPLLSCVLRARASMGQHRSGTSTRAHPRPTFNPVQLNLPPTLHLVVAHSNSFNPHGHTQSDMYLTFFIKLPISTTLFL